MRTCLRNSLFLLCFCLSAVPAGAQAQGINVGVGSGGVSVDVGSGGSGDSGGTTTGDLLGSTLDALGGGPAGSGSDQDKALRAVRTDAALPLERIMQIARQHTSDQIIDAQLITVRGFLLYDLKLLGNNGDVNHLYFYAKSGRLVQAN